MATYDVSVKRALTVPNSRTSSTTKSIARPTRRSSRRSGVRLDIRFGSSATTGSTHCTRLARSARRGRSPSFGWAKDGRERLDPRGEEFDATLDSQVPHPTFSDAEAETNNEFVERLEDNGTHTGLIVIAPHGGDIERHTDQQAERVASRLAAKGVSSWRCKGW